MSNAQAREDRRIRLYMTLPERTAWDLVFGPRATDKPTPKLQHRRHRIRKEMVRRNRVDMDQ